MRSPVLSNVQSDDNTAMLLVFILAIVLPLSTSFWIFTLLFSFSNEGLSTPSRWLFSLLLPLAITGWGIRKKNLDKSGAIAGLAVGFVLTYSSYCFCAALFSFFITSSKASKCRKHIKSKLFDKFHDGSQRNWIQVLCNGGVAAELGLIYLIDHGCGEMVIDFTNDYRGSWLSISILSALACSCGDTWASELGTVFGSSQPLLITTWRRVPRGTNGAVSVTGLIFSTLGGFVVGLAYYLTLLLSVNQHALLYSTPQWPLMLIGAMAGFFGSFVDSCLGATLQYSGLDEKTGFVVERPAAGVAHISGLTILDNHGVNLISNVITCLIMPKLAVHLWDIF